VTAAAGLILPELVIEVTPTLVISTAIATRDFQDVHHDRDRAVARGSKDIFINILTTTGLVQRYVTDWAGPEVIVRQIAIRLGVPCYAGDTLTFSGRVAAAGNGEPAGDGDRRPGVEPAGDGDRRPGVEPAGDGDRRLGVEPAAGADQEYVVHVVGRCSLGDHVTGTVRLSVPASAA